MSEYPEHDKLKAVMEESRAIGEFLDGNDKYVLAEWVKVEGFMRPQLQLLPVGRPINDILAEYFGIDMRTLESEKRAMLEKLKEMNNA